MEGKILKLRVHPRNFCEEELIVNIDALARERFKLHCGDIIEIGTPEEHDTTDKMTRLLLEVKALPQDIQTKGGPLSINQELSQAFNLTAGRKVCVRRVEREEVGVDLMELRFKDQCLTRSDMWRITCSLIDKCMYTQMKLEFAGMRTQVYDLWSHGKNVSCGAVVKTTRVVFRSGSAQVFLFVQMSSEMWDFDCNGDLYFDKAVSGFLKELFRRWKEEDCNHEVTLVFFWRVYYDVQSLDTLPPLARSSIQEDKRGMHYEDFYKVIVEGECVQDWNSKMVEIKQSFIQLPDLLHSTRDKDARVSSAANGNVLEAINLAVNVFANHYVDCNFLMTGQQVVIVTAGSGAFQVDQELTRLTKERIIDGGIGIDMICLTEQPLHAVPLFKFHNREDYHIPHWINYSFYSSTRPSGHVRFQPRLQLSDHLINIHLNRGERRAKGTKLHNPFSATSARTHVGDKLLSHRIDYDDHDAAIFTPSGHPKVCSFDPGTMSTSKSAWAFVTQQSDDGIVESDESQVIFGIGTPPDGDDPFEAQEHAVGVSPKNLGGVNMSSRHSSKDAAFSASLRVARARFRSETLEDCHSVDKAYPGLSGSAEDTRQFSLPRPHYLPTAARKQMTLINPFDPSKVHAEITAYHRRWMHAFPRNKEGYAFQGHHATIQEDQEEEKEEGFTQTGHGSSGVDGRVPRSKDEREELEDDSRSSGGGYPYPSDSLLRSPMNSRHSLKPRSSINNSSMGMRHKSKTKFSTDSFGFQQKSSSLFSFSRQPLEVNPRVLENFASVRRTGLDWKSLTQPACLPITTDFFPSQAIMNRDYFENPTKLVVSTYGSATGEATGEKTTAPWRSDHQNMNTFQVFHEMISQRVSQGFQLVFDLDNGGWGQTSVFSLHKALLEMQQSGKSSRKQNKTVVVKMSLGRVFHKIDLAYPDMFISIYRAKNHLHPPPTSYSYQLWPCGQDEFEATRTEFSHAKVQEYNWNYLDQHVCGYSDFEILGESQKYWRCRYLLLPSEAPHFPPFYNSQQRAQWESSLITNFVRFLEFLNHIKRGPGQTPLVHKSIPFQRHLSLPATVIESQLALTSPVPYKNHKLPDIEERRSASPRTIVSPRPGGSPKYTRRTSHAVTGDRGSEHRTRNRGREGRSERLREEGTSERRKGGTRAHKEKKERSSDRGTTERNSDSGIGERGGSNGDNSHSVGAELKLNLHSKLGGISPELLGRKVGSREDLQAFEKDFSTLKSSPQLSRKKSSHIIRELREAMTDTKDHVESFATTRRGRVTESLPVSPKTNSGLENSLDSSFLSESLNPSSPSPEPPLSSTSPLEQILEALGDPENGVDFLGKQSGLREGCFIAMEAVSWLMNNVAGAESRREAARIMQELVEEQLVRHASGDSSIPFLDGYFIYCIPGNKDEETTTERVERSFLIIEGMEFDVFTKKWFEVAIRFPSYSPHLNSTPIPIFATSPSPSSSPTSSLQHNHLPYYMGFKDKETTHHAPPPSMKRRYVELNPDPQSRSDRPEWSFVHYDHSYHPTRAFQLEFQWMVATVTLFGQLIQRWMHMASMCGFSLVAVPSLQSFSPSSSSTHEPRGTHPFRRQLFIPLSLPKEVSRKWKDCDTLTAANNLTSLLAGITNKSGFLLDPSCIPPDSDLLSPNYDSHDFLPSRLYVHHTGCALVQPVCEKNEEEEENGPEDEVNTSLHPPRPLKSSTPFASPRKKSPNSSPTSGMLADMKCGFYWYKNFLLPKQKNIPSSVLAQHDKVLGEFVGLCQNQDGNLSSLCKQVFCESF